jgi:hypothetical protein
METLLIGSKEIFPCCLVRIQIKVMLYVSSFLLLLVNAVTFRRVSKFFNWVAYFTLVYSVALWFDKLNIILLSTIIAMYEGLFHSISITYSFVLFLCIIGAIMLFTVYYPRRSQKSMGATGRKISFFLLTQYTGSCFDLFQKKRIIM